MEVAFTPLFDEQRKKYKFCFTCEDCAHFDGDTGACIHEFPNHMHRIDCYTAKPSPKTILFCKDFDLA